MCREPLTVGGGVSTEKISPRGLERSNRYVPSASHRADHFSSSPSRLGFSGAAIRSVYETPLAMDAVTKRAEELASE
jgi:hypothetical protein